MTRVLTRWVPESVHAPAVQTEFAKQRMKVLVERLGPVALWQECYLLFVKNCDT
jgi:hypothetical protein